MDRQKLGISTLTCSEQPVTMALEKVAALDFTWIDLGILNDWTDINPNRLVKDFERTIVPIEQKLKEKGLHVASINSGFGAKPFKYAIEEQCLALCQAAKRLHSRTGVTLPSGMLNEGWGTGLEILETAYKVFKSQGVDLMVETHCDHFTETIHDTLRLLERFPGLKLTLDASHYLVQGYGPKDWKVLLPWMSHCHVRPCGNQGFDTIQVELADAIPLAFQWPDLMVDYGYTGLFTFEIIDTIKVADAEKTTLLMRDEISDR
ncbi:sugar phosphate isomerase/epimerase [Pullulanibacillus pueri]|uniref:Xylose isomerase-like TIM barrel domain-containing protein n=1 Tax=Pullulanibacillus pueri TaxID=1437324 RepID=A0A8J2ZXL5_9BACL|nr:TIM barrel protein [Pullulanibacillus pueri]MBM7683878.1 sugar phosphate isomerase/epimerase [Pullulanibacillus pueri]GGH84641.1 hypothetical protein GCM10007096_28190 [Pullulanibacillus pueri]